MEYLYLTTPSPLFGFLLPQRPLHPGGLWRFRLHPFPTLLGCLFSLTLVTTSVRATAETMVVTIPASTRNSERPKAVSTDNETTSLSVISQGIATAAPHRIPHLNRVRDSADLAGSTEPFTELAFSPSSASRRSDWWMRLRRVLLQQDYNTRMVFWGTGLLGAAAGAVGVFMLLRKRALLGDVISHASLPGIAMAYLVMEMAWPGEGKSLPGLLIGAALGGVIGVLGTTAIRRWTRIHDDAALAIVLSVFFGFGISLLTVIQRLPGGNAAGLTHFIYGKAASMTSADVQAIALVAAVVGGLCLLLFKEFTVLCFDDRYAATQGWPTLALDLLLMVLVVAVTVIGLQSVGLLLVVAMLIIPAASARFWTDHLGALLLLAILCGMAMAVGGVIISSLIPRVATGAVIVLAGTTLFVTSMFLGTRRGVLRHTLIQQQTRRRTQREHLLRGIYELLESAEPTPPTPTETQSFGRSVGIAKLQPLRSWTSSQLKRLLRAAERRGWVTPSGDGVRLTNLGLTEARRLVRNHRLWEIYLIHYADTAPAHVDRNADRIEHLIDADLLAELETKLAANHPEVRLPESPHGS